MKYGKRILIAAASLGAAAVTTTVVSSKAHDGTSVTQQSPQPKTTSAVKQLWHCGMHPQVIQDHPGFCPICHMALTPLVDHDHSTSDAGNSVVTIDPAVVQNMGVRTATVVRAPLNRSVRALGVFKLPEPGFHDVSLRVSGWIEKLYADQEGMHVVKGEPLFDLYSPDLQIAEQELITATKTSKTLGGGDDARGLVESARRKLQLWGIADRDIDAIAKCESPPKTVPIRSPATGHVQDKSVVQGSAVAATAKAMRIVDHAKMWLEAHVYQDDIDAVRLGDAIRVTVDGMPGKQWTGKITFIAPHLDHASRTLTVRTTIDNPDFAIKPGTYGAAQIIENPIANALLVPREAVIDTGTRQIVFLDEGDGHFAARSVRTGAAGDGGVVQILDGLTQGAVVVTSGQFLLDAESRTTEAVAKFSTGKTTDEKGAAQ